MTKGDDIRQCFELLQEAYLAFTVHRSVTVSEFLDLVRVHTEGTTDKELIEHLKTIERNARGR